VTTLPYFGHAATTIDDVPVVVSRTGYTGDLGYEVLVPRAGATALWDAVTEAGAGRGLIPVGHTALLMLRIEAGLLLLDVDYHSSRFAENDHHRSTPYELGLAWMLRSIDDDTRNFVGRRALRSHRSSLPRWVFAGVAVDPADFDRRHLSAGLLPPKDPHPQHGDTVVYDPEGEQVGYATSLMYSPVLQRYVALARLRPQSAAAGTSVRLEFTINHRYERIASQVVSLPFYNPPRKTG
jgi:aminomethyltransferase